MLDCMMFVDQVGLYSYIYLDRKMSDCMMFVDEVGLYSYI